jgi:recombining binding protein (suppressor of hairless)
LCTDQVRYNFWIPPVLFNEQLGSSGRLAPVPSTPVTPFPGVLRYLRADRAAEVVRHHPQNATAPHPDAHKMLTLYGENFSRAAPPRVFFGAEPSPFVEVRCTEVVGCLPPKDDIPEHAERRPIILVRGDGVVYPSATMYP